MPARDPFGCAQGRLSLRLKYGCVRDDAGRDAIVRIHTGPPLAARCWAEIMSDSQFFTGLRTITVNEVACRRTLLSFELNLEEFERSIVATADHQTIAV